MELNDGQVSSPSSNILNFKCETVYFCWIVDCRIRPLRWIFVPLSIQLNNWIWTFCLGIWNLCILNQCMELLNLVHITVDSRALTENGYFIYITFNLEGFRHKTVFGYYYLFMKCGVFISGLPDLFFYCSKMNTFYPKNETHVHGINWNI